MNIHLDETQQKCLDPMRKKLEWMSKFLWDWSVRMQSIGVFFRRVSFIFAGKARIVLNYHRVITIINYQIPKSLRIRCVSFEPKGFLRENPKV
jgi:hypothetical protein